MRIALIVPASNTVMEPDFHRTLGTAATVSTWRIHLESVTRAAEERMLAEELPRCLSHMEPTRPRLVVFGCTSAGALGGLAHDERMRRDISARVGAEVVTVVGSMASELSGAAARRVAVFTPYAPELTESVAGCVAEAGYEIATVRGMGILDNREIGAMEPAAIVDFVRAGMRGVSADALFLSCTNWRALEAIGPLHAELGLPLLSSNQVTLASVERFMAS
jgi:maleate isomerase